MTIPIALQLYSIRDECTKDLESTLRSVKEMGYEGIEFAGYYGEDITKTKRLLDDIGLKVAGSHVSFDLLLGEELEKTIELHSTIGNRFLIIPWLPEEYRSTKQALDKTVNLINELSEKLKTYNMYIGFHCHSVDFKIIDKDKTIWDIIASNTKEEVIMQIDTGNTMHGGADPITMLEKYPKRAKTIHLKEFSSENKEVLIGEGEVRWKDVFRICERDNTEWYIIEQEVYPYPPLESVKKCIENLKNMLQ